MKTGRRVVLLGLLLSFEFLNAQSDFRPGYVIKMVGDTIFGQIDFRGDLFMSSLCRFKSVNNLITDYSPDDIMAFRFLDSKYYVSKVINDKKVFMEYLIKAKINIYYMRDEKGDHYYVDKDGFNLTEIPYEENMKILEDRNVLFESTRHIGVLKYFMQDVPELQSKILSVKKPNHQNLIKLAEIYHNAVCNEEQCIVYDKKPPFLKISISPFWGLTKYSVSGNYYNEFGGYLYLWSSRNNEKFYFKTGFISHKVTEDGEDMNVYKIPLQIQYIYRVYKIQPSISGGINVLYLKQNSYYDIGQTLSLNAGLDFKISGKLSVSTAINSDYTPLFDVFTKSDLNFGLISYSITLGFRFDI